MDGALAEERLAVWEKFWGIQLTHSVGFWAGLHGHGPSLCGECARAAQGRLALSAFAAASADMVWAKNWIATIETTHASIPLLGSLPSTTFFSDSPPSNPAEYWQRWMQAWSMIYFRGEQSVAIPQWDSPRAAGGTAIASLLSTQIPSLVVMERYVNTIYTYLLGPSAQDQRSDDAIRIHRSLPIHQHTREALGEYMPSSKESNPVAFDEASESLIVTWSEFWGSTLTSLTDQGKRRHGCETESCVKCTVMARGVLALMAYATAHRFPNWGHGWWSAFDSTGQTMPPDYIHTTILDFPEPRANDLDFTFTSWNDAWSYLWQGEYTEQVAMRSHDHPQAWRNSWRNASGFTAMTAVAACTGPRAAVAERYARVLYAGMGHPEQRAYHTDTVVATLPVPTVEGEARPSRWKRLRRRSR